MEYHDPATSLTLIVSILLSFSDNSFRKNACFCTKLCTKLNLLAKLDSISYIIKIRQWCTYCDNGDTYSVDSKPFVYVIYCLSICRHRLSNISFTSQIGFQQNSSDYSASSELHEVNFEG